MKIVLNTELVRVVSEKGKLNLYIRVANNKSEWILQRPYDADLRGQIAALTLAIDALAGKIIAQDVVQLDERDFTEQKQNIVEAFGAKMISAVKV